MERLDRLRAGLSKGVASTIALALGLDIGSLSCVVLGGYPGGLAKTWQMLGRAGRRGPGLQVFLVGETFMDRYWAEAPKEMLEQKRHLEEIVIAPDNHEILKRHIIAANYDHPLRPARDRLFFGPESDSVLDEVLSSKGLTWNEEDSEFLVFTDYNSNDVFRIPLRSTSRFKVAAFLGKVGGKTVLEEDEVRALRTLYPGAIFVDDVYSIGVVLAEMLTGRHPSPDRLRSRPAGIPPALDTLIVKAMSARTSRDRFTDAGELTPNGFCRCFR